MAATRWRAPRRAAAVEPAGRRAPAARAGAAAQASASGAAVGAALAPSDKPLGRLFLALLPHQLFYLPGYIMPLTCILAGVGAAWPVQLLQWLAALPPVQLLPQVSQTLSYAATTQPWTSLVAVAVSLAAAWYAFALIPILDVLLGCDLRNPSKEEEEEEAAAAHQGVSYRLMLYCYVPLHYAALLSVCHLLCTQAVPALPFLGATLSMGVAGGIMFTVAHELLHGPGRLDRWLANALLATAGYQHWAASHLAHHVKVATPEDPSTARRGEVLWSFIPRSVVGNVVDGYSAEAERLRARGIPLLSPRNRMFAWVASPVALAGTALAAYGVRGLAFYLLVAVTSVIMLETVNYVEHYGLMRSKGADGRYERVGARHSWSCATLFTNAMAFRLQRHADHHLHGSRPYHLLRNLPDAPNLPASYPAMMLLSTLPPLFFRVMDPLADAAAASQAGAGGGEVPQGAQELLVWQA